VPVWIRRIRLQDVGINHARMGAVNGNAHAPAGVSTRLTPNRGYA
jgi:hypothetical protein